MTRSLLEESAHSFSFDKDIGSFNCNVVIVQNSFILNIVITFVTNATHKAS
jgi:hypothetical protein